MIVSFDFDGTLHRDGEPLWPALALLRWHHQSDHHVMIVTTRTEAHEHPTWWRVHEPRRVVIGNFLARYRLPVQSVIYTSHQAKAKTLTLVRCGIELHYDDDPNEVAMAADTSVQVVLLNGVTLHA